MTETIKDMESFPDGEPKKLKGYENRPEKNIFKKFLRRRV